MMRHHGFGMTKVFALLAAFACALAHFGGASVQAQATRPIKLVALGDSLTAGYNLPADAAFPAVLEKALRARGHAVEVANAGVSGDTASGGLDRLDWSVPEGTDGVILELGANDMLRGLDPDVTRRAIDGIVTRLKGRGVAVMLGGMLAARNLGPDYVRRFDAIYRDIAQKHGLVLYPFFMEGVVGERSLMLPDGLHPTAKGVERIVAGILPSVETFLDRIKRRGG
jgi:acyl-CoA thioesterase-1